MQGRLSELLERIRPAGSPGAPADGEHIGERRRNEELAELIAVLEEFEREARRRVERAQADADRIGRDGARQVRAIRSTLTERVAEAEARASHTVTTRSEVAESALIEDMHRELARLGERADDQVPRLVDEAVDLVWASFGLDDTRSP